jgi:hypothetical protein
MRNMKNLLSLLATLAAIAAANAQGTFEAISDYSRGGAVTVSVPGTGGWTFQPQVQITISELGALEIFDLGSTISIGLWTENGTILGSASVTLTNSSPTGNGREYAAISPVVLSAGQTYRIGAFDTNFAGLGSYVVFPAPSTNGSVTLSPDITLGAYAYSSDGAFGFPGTLGSDGQMLLGPTFLYTKSVPEPAVLALLCLGGLGVLLQARKSNFKAPELPQKGTKKHKKSC